MRAIAIAAAVACVVSSTQAAADDRTSSTNDTKTVAEVLFYTARGMLEAGKVSLACEKFAESYRLDATPGTLLNLAVCHEKEGKIASAWGEFREAIADAKKTGRTDREELAREHIVTIESDLPMLTVEVPPAVRVKGIQVHRNGSALSEAAWETPIPADPGVVKIEVSAPGFHTSTKEVTIARKQRLSVTLDPLVPLPVVVPPTPFLTARRTTGLVVGGLGLAALAVGAGFGVSTIDSVHRSDAACPVQDGERRCSAEGVAAMNQANAQGWVSTIAIGAGAAATAFGVYLVVTQGSQEPPPPDEGGATAARAPRIVWSCSVVPASGGARAAFGAQF